MAELVDASDLKSHLKPLWILVFLMIAEVWELRSGHVIAQIRSLFAKCGKVVGQVDEFYAILP